MNTNNDGDGTGNGEVDLFEALPAERPAPAADPAALESLRTGMDAVLRELAELREAVQALEMEPATLETLRADMAGVIRGLGGLREAVQALETEPATLETLRTDLAGVIRGLGGLQETVLALSREPSSEGAQETSEEAQERRDAWSAWSEDVAIRTTTKMGAELARQLHETRQAFLKDVINGLDRISNGQFRDVLNMVDGLRFGRWRTVALCLVVFTAGLFSGVGALVLYRLL